MPTIAINHRLNGLEIRFERKPDAATLSRLHADHWHWSRRNGCWYQEYSQTALESASSLGCATEVEEIRSTDYGLRSMTDLDSQFEDWCADVCGR